MSETTILVILIMLTLLYGIVAIVVTVMKENAAIFRQMRIDLYAHIQNEEGSSP